MKPQTLSVVIATYNCEDRIEGTIRPWTWANEIIVVDQMSDDSTVLLAQKCGATIIQNKPLDGNFDLNRKLAMTKAKSEWILYIDTDERPTDALIHEIKYFLKNAMPQITGVRIPNDFYFLGKALKYGIYNKRHAEIRMVKKGMWNYPCEDGFHRGLSLIGGNTHRMTSSYKHFNVNSLSEWFIKTNQYTQNDIDIKNSRSWTPLLSLLSFIFKTFIIKRGFLDGWRGFLASFYFGLYHFTLSAKSWEYNELSRLKLDVDYLKPLKPNSR